MASHHRRMVVGKCIYGNGRRNFQRLGLFRSRKRSTDKLHGLHNGVISAIHIHDGEESDCSRPVSGPDGELDLGLAVTSTCAACSLALVIE
jgi:hypothetical protein